MRHSRSSFDVGLRLISGILPAALAAAGSSSTALAAHDDGVVRTVGAGFTGAFRALDLIASAPALLLPFGTRAFRAGLASAMVTGICGAIAFDIALALVTIAVPAALHAVGVRGDNNNVVKTSPRLLAGVAAVSVLSALLAPAWQIEASAPGGSVTGALLVLLTIHTALSTLLASPSPSASRDVGSSNAAEAKIEEMPWPMFALLLGLAASYEPLTFASTIAVMAPVLVARRALKAKSKSESKSESKSDSKSDSDSKSKPKLDGVDRATWLRIAIAFLLGLAPLGLGMALMRRPADLALSTPPFSLVDQFSTYLVTLPGFALSEIGTLLGTVCVLGAALSIYGAASRTLGIALSVVIAVGALGIALLHAPAGPSRFDASVLVAIACAFILAGTMLGTLVVAISRARVPFAEASAALVVVLELVLPIKAIDETTTRRDARVPNAAAIWNDVAWGAAPPAAVIIIPDRRTMRRIASARAAGDMRGDLVIVPSFDVQGEEGQRALIAEPKLAPLYRDMALGVAPEELSLAQLGAQRAALASFDPKWDRALSRHLVPVGLTSRFEPEPRGASDRKKALDQFAPSKDRLARVTVVKRDPELAQATAKLLRARAIGMAATGERDVLSHALDDLRTFAPDDPIGTILVRRIVTAKGPIDVHDLVP